MTASRDFPICYECGYDLRGVRGLDGQNRITCPECGASIEPRVGFYARPGWRLAPVYAYASAAAVGLVYALVLSYLAPRTDPGATVFGEIHVGPGSRVIDGLFCFPFLLIVFGAAVGLTTPMIRYRLVHEPPSRFPSPWWNYRVQVGFVLFLLGSGMLQSLFVQVIHGVIAVLTMT